MRRAFTLIELVVAMGILALILSFAGVIFKAGTGAQRMAMANAEIMEKLRVITAQLDADLKGMIVSYGGHGTSGTTIVTDADDKVLATEHHDSLAFFANGDFQSTRQYGGQTIVGNVASLCYCLADPNGEARERVLLRRQTILAPEAPSAGSAPDGEYYAGSLEQWRVDSPYTDANDWSATPDLTKFNMEVKMPMYLAKGVGDFMIEYLPRGTALGAGGIPWMRFDPEGTDTIDPERTDAIDPVAFKMTFTLYDSKGILKHGRTFTHIVLVGG